MKVFITGLSGFVGRHLREQLARRHRVVGISGEDGEIRDAAWVATVVARARPDWIFHLAGQAFVPRSWEDPRETLDINAAGTLNVLAAARKLRKVRLLVVSSIEVYGDSAGRITEESPLRPQSPYATSKVTAEFLAHNYAARYGLHVVIVRPTNHIGPGQSSQFAISDWGRQLARGARQLHVGNLNTFRDFLDVRDVVRAYECALARGASGETYNITSEHPVKMRDVLTKLIAISGVPAKITVDPRRFRKSRGETRVIRSGKFRRATGWRPSIALESSLQDVLEYWRACDS